MVVFDGKDYQEAQILKMDSLNRNEMAFVLPQIPRWDMHLIWAINSNGASKPMVINKTEAWWSLPDVAHRGATVAVMGRNLSFRNGTDTSSVYIQNKQTGVGFWATVKKVNPYRVEFQLPNTIAYGDYKIWVHNGHGREYGWSEPIALKVNPINQWNNTVFNVKNFGAVGDGTTDDTFAVLSAMDAADAVEYSTVYIPKGRYKINRNITPGDRFRVIGAGMDSTFLVSAYPLDVNNRTAFLFTVFNSDSLFFKNMTLKLIDTAEVANPNTSTRTVAYLRGQRYMRFDSVRFDSQTQSVDMNNSNHLIFKHCEFIGSGFFAGVSRQITVDSCRFIGNQDANQFYLLWGGGQTSFTNNTFQHQDTTIVTGWAQGRTFVTQSIWDATENLYIANNRTYNLAVREGFNNSNTGEQILLESGENLVSLPIVSATDSSFTLVNNWTGDFSENKIAFIEKGKGIGQAFKIKNNVGKVFYLANNKWNLMPDATSKIRISKSLNKTVIYKNTLQGRGNYRVFSSATAGIQSYGDCFNMIVDSNKIERVNVGLANWALVNSQGISPVWNNLYVKNSVRDAYTGLYLVTHAFTNVPPQPTGESSTGNIFRKNYAELCDNGITLQAPILTNTEPLRFGIFDKNRFQNILKGYDEEVSGFYGYTRARDIILYKNNFIGKASSASTNQLFYFQANPSKPFFLKNTTQNFNASNFSVEKAKQIWTANQNLKLADTTRKVKILFANVGVKKFAWNLTVPSGVSSNKMSGNLDSLKTDSLIVTLVNPVSSTYQITLNDVGGSTQKININLLRPQAISRQSGNWNDQNTWLCGAKPSNISDTFIKTGHTVILLNPIQGFSRRLFVDVGAVFDIKGVINLKNP